MKKRSHEDLPFVFYRRIAIIRQRGSRNFSFMRKAISGGVKFPLNNKLQALWSESGSSIVCSSDDGSCCALGIRWCRLYPLPLFLSLFRIALLHFHVEVAIKKMSVVADLRAVATLNFFILISSGKLFDFISSPFVPIPI